MPPTAHPETDNETTMLIPRVKVAEGPEDRVKVTPTATARRLVSVPADRAELGADSPDEVLAADVARHGGSRRAVMERYHVGSGRATKIIQMSREVSNGGAQASAR